MSTPSTHPRHGKRPAKLARVHPIAVAACLGILSAGCGASGPSAQLTDARVAYSRAEQSKAPDLAPDKLLTAKQALDRAERANNDDAGSVSEKHFAYMAERKALAAVAYADLEAADREYKIAERDYREALEAEAAMAKRERERTKRELEAVRRELAQKGNKLDESTNTLKKREKELSEKAKALEAERKKRLAAEARARAAIKSLEEIARVREEQRGIVITLSGAVLFTTNASQLLDIAKNKLGSVATALNETDERRQIVVGGHTDSRGSDSYNRKLSLERARSVRSYLVSKGVPASRVTAIGKGEDEPVASNRDAEGRANNRRVEIIVSPL